MSNTICAIFSDEFLNENHPAPGTRIDPDAVGFREPYCSPRCTERPEVIKIANSLRCESPVYHFYTELAMVMIRDGAPSDIGPNGLEWLNFLVERYPRVPWCYVCRFGLRRLT